LYGHGEDAVLGVERRRIQREREYDERDASSHSQSSSDGPVIRDSHGGTARRIRISFARDGFDEAEQRNAPKSVLVALLSEEEQEAHRPAGCVSKF
jgi:hypothetical protein